MRFSAAIHQFVAREAAPLPLKNAQDADRDDRPEPPVPQAVQEPPPDLDQRVRLSGEW
jgi:hypothetical protein